MLWVSMTKTKRLIYVVDDEATIANTLALILEGSGFEAVPFTEPIQALRAAESRCPDILITDVSMPMMNGIDLSIQFKAIYPACRILLFSGAMRTAGLLADAERKGHNFKILAKPVHPKELLAKLERLEDPE